MNYAELLLELDMRQAKVKELTAENRQLNTSLDSIIDNVPKLQATITELEADAMIGKNIELRRKVEQLTAALKEIKYVAGHGTKPYEIAKTALKQGE